MFYFRTLNSVTQIFVITVKGFKYAKSWVRDRDATTVLARHVLESRYLN